VPRITLQTLQSVGGASERDGRTCRFSIGRPDGLHLWCKRHRLVVVFPCWWERESGTEQRQESLHAADFL
jgi:hypothetical protein